MLNDLQKSLMEKVSGLHDIPQGAVALRVNGETKYYSGTKQIQIVKRQDGNGFTANIMADTKGKSLHVPALIDTENINEDVVNTFNVGQNSDVVIVAGCGIHNNGKKQSSHNGKHVFMIGENCHVKYIERHFAEGNSHKQMSPRTEIFLGKNSVLEIETTQFEGVDLSERLTNASLQDGAKLYVKEKVVTSGNQHADSTIAVMLKGKNARAHVISRSVAKDTSTQCFLSSLIGMNECFGRIECDAIVLDRAAVSSAPTIFAKDQKASLTHEAQVGRIANEQLTKLMTLGLTQEEAEQKILEGFMNS
ncbi:MAG: SufD family Fe-S cluster assembly protein [Clostridia bacterium]|nr:SufD family Fe-S cluster assembly protein [Clostridia bacterium]MBR2052549.1 SufD family Fe-S cluster assembly protein [Clostridia bacterium]MBR2221271.1 SufD family Fe-S cluster assembly protein [Clostridia bacterium]MBR2433083.1 SufD family Fe-S cluster assembly protein [Clostridia bacterium]MBR3790544.1 SufD family Fe-S cluster assembly protein [Clostridia bacterium]